jgi:pyruvate dehydrogenase E2 component (dihydrolipoamide acetyltransferase)
MADFVMPSLGADMAAGTLYEWRVAAGTAVSRGDIMAEVETDKGVIEIEVWEEGVVDALLVAPGTEVPVGAVIATIRAPGGAASSPPEKEPGRVEEAKPEPHPMDHHPLLAGREPSTNGRRLRVSPAARRLASELNVDLATLTGTGQDGAITLSDVEQAAAQTAVPERIKISPVAQRMAEDLGLDLATITGTGPGGAISKKDVQCAAGQLRAQERREAPPSPTAAPPSSTEAVARPTAKEDKADAQAAMRRAIAAAMAKANREIPHYYLETRIDMSKSLAWLEAQNVQRSIKERILPVVLLIKASALALTDVPKLNGYWLDDALQMQEAINIGFAIALRQGGLVTPAIHNTDLKSLDELMEAMRDLIMRTRAGRLRGSELTDATVTLTSLGDMGVEKVYGVIYPPQVALIGFGKTMEQPWAENGMLGIRPVLTATVAGDHRASDGRTGAQFLEALDKHLQEPEAL